MSDTFGTLLRQHRKARRLSQYRLARLVGVDTSYCSRIEAGTRTPSVDVIQTMCRVLELTGTDAHTLYGAGGYLHPECVPVALTSLTASLEVHLRAITEDLLRQYGQESDVA